MPLQLLEYLGGPVPVPVPVRGPVYFVSLHPCDALSEGVLVAAQIRRVGLRGDGRGGGGRMRGGAVRAAAPAASAAGQEGGG